LSIHLPCPAAGNQAELEADDPSWCGGWWRRLAWRPQRLARWRRGPWVAVACHWLPFSSSRLLPCLWLHIAALRAQSGETRGQILVAGKHALVIFLLCLRLWAQKLYGVQSATRPMTRAWALRALGPGLPLSVCALVWVV
jgi:hypothetical protein